MMNKKLPVMKKLESLLLLLLLISGFLVRFYRFSNPVADWHSWRQADTSAVSRNFVKYGFDVMHPRMDNLSNVQSGLDNPRGYFFAEFPVFNVLQAGGFILFGHFTIEEWGRLISIISSVAGMLFVFLLVRRHANSFAALASLFFYAFIPFSIYYGRTILPDSLGLAFLLGGLYFFDTWLLFTIPSAVKHIKSKQVLREYLFFVISLLSSICALLVRPHVVFFLPVFVYLLWKNFGLSFFKKWQVYLYTLLAVLPFGFWRVWMTQYPEGIPASAWLFNEGNIRFTGAFFYWLFAERIGRLILGYWGTSLLVLGLLWKRGKNYGFFIWFFLGSLLYMIVIARGNVQHDYYQYITIPSIVMLLGCGLDGFVRFPKEYMNKWMSYGLACVVTIFMLAFGWYYVRDYFNINNLAIVRAGEAVNRLTPMNARIIAPYDGDSSFLYQTNRFGWASFEKPLPEMVNHLGADYLVLVNPKPQDYGIGKEYKIVSSTSDYLLFNLREKP